MDSTVIDLMGYTTCLAMFSTVVLAVVAALVYRRYRQVLQAYEDLHSSALAHIQAESDRANRAVAMYNELRRKTDGRA